MNEDIKVTLDEGTIQYGRLKIGTTATGEAGTKAKVENSGTGANAVLNFTIPKGDRGIQGIQGIQGEKGEDGAIQYTAGEGIKITDDNVIQFDKSLGSIVVDSIRSKNKFDKKKATPSKIISRATGSTSTNADYSTTDYIPVSSGMKLMFTGFNQYYNAFYDKDKNYIGYTDVLNPMVVIDGAKYMRTSLLTANLDTAQIEEGEVATPHSEYIDFNNIISDVTNHFTINSEVAALNTNYTSKIYKSGNAIWLNLHLTLNTGVTGTIENVVVGNLSSAIKPITPVFDRCLIGTSDYNGWNFNVPDGHVYINSTGNITIRNFTTTSAEKKYITINLVYFAG